MPSPINNPAKLTTLVVYGSQLTIHSSIQTALRTLAVGDAIIDISVVRKSVGNNYMAIITYEDQQQEQRKVQQNREVKKYASIEKRI